MSTRSVCVLPLAFVVFATTAAQADCEQRSREALAQLQSSATGPLDASASSAALQILRDLCLDAASAVPGATVTRSKNATVYSTAPISPQPRGFDEDQQLPPMILDVDERAFRERATDSDPTRGR